MDLSHVAALRPVRVPDAGGFAPSPRPASDGARDAVSHSEELRGLVGGQVVSNRFGQCLRVRRRFPQPPPVRLPARSRRCLVPEATPGAADAVGDPGNWLFLDTETTGLSGGTGTYAFLIGLGWWETLETERDATDGEKAAGLFAGAEVFVVEQYFMRDHGEERALLAEVAARLDRRRVLVTFNGKSFDWPL